MTTHTSSSNPYVGPRPFQPGERIYGRDQEIYDLLDLLIAERIVLLYSPSGAGKTSLIQAGLLPELEQEGFQALPVMRVSLEPPLEVREALGEYNRYILSLLLSLEEGVPKDHQIPLTALAMMTLTEYLERRTFPAVAQVVDVNMEDAQAPPAVQPTYSQSGDFASGKIVLIFDQFEEILTVDPTDHEAKVEFFTQIGAALRHRDYWALFSMREEFPARLDPYVRHVPTRLSNRFRLERLDVGSAAAAIQEPVQEIGMMFTGTATTKLVDDLRRVRVQQPDGMIAELPGMYVEPVQLQVVCHRLWNYLPEGITEIQEDDIRAAGDVDSALAGYYAERVQEIAQQVGVSERSIREWFLHHLITDQGIRGQIVKEPEQTQGLANKAIEELVDAHLVRAEQRRGVTWYELAHDRLIEPVQLDNFDWLQEHLSTLQREAALWELQERTSGLLLRDEALKEIEQWAADHHAELTETEEEFLQACREEQVRVQRERLKSRFIRGLAIAATIVMCIAVFFYLNAEIRRKEMERLSLVSVAQNVINAAIQQKHDDVKLLLLRQAYLFNLRGRGNILARIDRQLRQDFKTPSFSRVRYFDDEVMAVAVSADGRYLACGIGNGTIQIFDLETPGSAPFKLTGHQGPVCALAFHPEGRFLGSAGWDRTLRLWEDPFSESAPVILYGHSSAVFSVAFSPDGNRVASGGWDGTVRLWDLRNLQQSGLILQGHTAGVNAVTFRPDGQMLASGSSDKTVRLWNLQELRRPPQILLRQQDARTRPMDEVNALAFSPDGASLVAGTSGKQIWIWNMRNLRQMPQIREGHSDKVLATAFSPDGQSLASGSSDRTVRLWNLQDVQAKPEILHGHDDLVLSVAFSPDGRFLASGGNDDTLRVWELQAPDDPNLVLLSPFDEEVEKQAAIPERPQLPNSRSDRDKQQQSQRPRFLHTLTFSPDGQRLYAATGENEIIEWTQAEEVDVFAFPESSKRKTTVAVFSPDGSRIALGDDSGTINLWEVDSTSLFPVTLTGHSGSIDTLVFHPAGSLLASGGEDHTIRIWDLQAPTNAPLVLRGHEGAIQTLAFHPTEHVLASGSTDQSIRLWNLQFPEYPPVVFSGHEAALLTSAFAMDGTVLVAVDQDNAIRLWPLQNLRTDFFWLLQFRPIPIVLSEGEELVSSIAISPDGQRLGVRKQYDIYVWDLHNLDAPPVIIAENRPRPPSESRPQPVTAPALPDDGAPPVSVPRADLPEQQNSTRQPLVFSPDGTFLASGFHNTSVMLRIRTEALVDAVCQRVWRNLTPEEWDQLIGAGIPYEATCADLR